MGEDFAGLDDGALDIAELAAPDGRAALGPRAVRPRVVVHFDPGPPRSLCADGRGEGGEGGEGEEDR